MKFLLPVVEVPSDESLPVRGAWIEIALALVKSHKKQSLPVRGAWIEMVGAAGTIGNGMSLPVRGAWIEMGQSCFAGSCGRGRSPCGERGLKYSARLQPQARARRSPCGERGLK